MDAQYLISVARGMRAAWPAGDAAIPTVASLSQCARCGNGIGSNQQGDQSVVVGGTNPAPTAHEAEQRY